MAFNTMNYKIGQNIKFVRKINGITQVELSYLFDTSQARVQAVEAGRLDVKPDWIHALQKELKVNPLFILGYSMDIYDTTLRMLTVMQEQAIAPAYSPTVNSLKQKITKIRASAEKNKLKARPVEA